MLENLDIRGFYVTLSLHEREKKGQPLYYDPDYYCT